MYEPPKLASSAPGDAVYHGLQEFSGFDWASAALPTTAAVLHPLGVEPVVRAMNELSPESEGGGRATWPQEFPARLNSGDLGVSR
jgi:hypothetical protein